METDFEKCGGKKGNIPRKKRMKYESMIDRGGASKVVLFFPVYNSYNSVGSK